MRSPEPRWRRLVREPLLHFALLGAAVFAAHYALAPPADPPDARVLVLDDAFVDGLRERARARGAHPDDAALERAWIREEVLVREARRLGLERGDPIVRRRLVQKLELWLEAQADVPAPDDDDLARHLRAHADRYRRPPRVGFTHVFFGRDRADPIGDARAALDALRADGAAPTDLGDPFLLGRDQPPRPVAAVAGSFGPSFAEAVAGAPRDAWAGPFQSSYGAHLVRVTERTEGSLPSVDAVRERLTADWRRARREEAVARAVERLVERYRVERR
ncbi:MAG TPA: peptidylprolyl isomerase [Sandaracinaceae bacterium LLY-WYZ-13_1]|nr:peptidylprolyl isomerase [Sandaracinaceae bacterium LLY-WYZ-13_1]